MQIRQNMYKNNVFYEKFTFFHITFLSCDAQDVRSLRNRNTMFSFLPLSGQLDSEDFLLKPLVLLLHSKNIRVQHSVRRLHPWLGQKREMTERIVYNDPKKYADT